MLCSILCNVVDKGGFKTNTGYTIIFSQFYSSDPKKTSTLRQYIHFANGSTFILQGLNSMISWNNFKRTRKG